MISSSSIGKKVRYEDIAVGVVQTTTFFGIGGVNKDALVLEAKRKLIASRPLTTNEEYANFTLDFKRTLFLSFSRTKVTMSADVVRYISDNANDSIKDVYSDAYKAKLLGQKTVSGIFNIGDSILYNLENNHLYYGQILAFEKNNKVRILYKTKNENYRSRKLSIDEIYSIITAHKGLKKGHICAGKFFE